MQINCSAFYLHGLTTALSILGQTSGCQKDIAETAPAVLLRLELTSYRSTLVPKYLPMQYPTDAQ